MLDINIVKHGMHWKTFRCSDCGCIFEAVMDGKETTLEDIRCPECWSKEIEVEE